MDNDDAVQIFAGDSPETIDMQAPVAEARGQNSVELSLPEHIVNPYFNIARQGSPGVVWAQRQLPLEKSYNFRDIGGYRTQENRRMRWGMVFRSAHLARAYG